jgi:hypothetical protein
MYNLWPKFTSMPSIEPPKASDSQPDGNAVWLELSTQPHLSCCLFYVLLCCYEKMDPLVEDEEMDALPQEMSWRWKMP